MADYLPIVVGVDPGSGGGLAFIARDIQHPFAEACKMPETRKDLIELLDKYGSGLRIAYVERVRSSPQMGVVSAFTFGCNYERVVMALMCLGIPVEEVTPQKWQKAFTLTKGRGLGLSPTEKKNDHKAVAQQLYPNLKVTLATCDALLIAAYGRKVMQ